jgi:hypothetical protein
MKPFPRAFGSQTIRVNLGDFTSRRRVDHVGDGSGIDQEELGGSVESVGTEISGALGFATLNLLELKIDYRDGLVDLSYDPNRRH